MSACVWSECRGRPPRPPPEKRLVLADDWGGLPTRAGDSVYYQCEREELRFDDDKDGKIIRVECRNDGRFDEPARWPECVEGM